MHSDEHVHDVDKVEEVIDDMPSHGEEVLQFPENGSTDHKDQVVYDSAVDDAEPLEHMTIVSKQNCKFTCSVYTR